LFQANLYPTLIGSFPGKDHLKAVKAVLNHCKEVPCWPQLPAYPQEEMLRQFSRGLPGLDTERLILDPSSAGFEEEMLSFYEDYMALTEGAKDWPETRFVMTREEAPGLFLLLEEIEEQALKPQALKPQALKPQALKGQVTGPFTLGVGLKTPDGKAVFYDVQARDLVTKLVALKAAWQTDFLKAQGVPVLMFFDEPALAGFGSSAYVGVSEEDVVQVLSEVSETIKAKGAVPGTHVCANTEWRLLVKSGVSVISFDAFDYLDRFLLFYGDLREFLRNGGIIAWGIVPTLKPEALEQMSAKELGTRLKEAMTTLAQKTGVDLAQIASQSLITPSCGMGTLNEELAEHALKLNRQVADGLREELL